jgi:TRAP-type uncharacterized transport system substrate-binding protein
MDKQFTMCVSGFGEPWWTVGEVTQRLMAPLGYDITLESRSGSIENPRWMARREGLVGVSMPYYVRWARDGQHNYVGETFPEFRAIAGVFLPHWEAVAATWDSGITSLHQVREQQRPVRVFIGNPQTAVGQLAYRILKHYGLTREMIESWGGRFIVLNQDRDVMRRRDVDLIISLAYNGNSQMCRYWEEASILMNLRFLDLEPALIDAMVEEYGFDRGSLPRRLFPGVDRDVPTVVHQNVLVYALADLPDELAYTLAKAYDDGRAAFRETPLPFSYDPIGAWQKAEIELHPAAEAYYREKGYMS